MVAEIGDTTEDTGTGAGDTLTETQMDRRNVTTRDSVADEVVNLVGEMEITVEAEVRKREMVTTPTLPPPRRAENAGQRSELGGSLRLDTYPNPA